MIPRNVKLEKNYLAVEEEKGGGWTSDWDFVTSDTHRPITIHERFFQKCHITQKLTLYGWSDMNRSIDQLNSATHIGINFILVSDCTFFCQAW